jgi:hypothetical protein
LNTNFRKKKFSPLRGLLQGTPKLKTPKCYPKVNLQNPWGPLRETPRKSKRINGTRKELTDEWQERGMKKGLEYDILTNEITKAWADKDVKDYKKHKGLKKEKLRDNMSNLELVLNMQAEASTTEISKEKKPEGLAENKDIARKGGTAAKKARLEIEKQIGKSIVSPHNAKTVTDNPKKKIEKG